MSFVGFTKNKNKMKIFLSNIAWPWSSLELYHQDSVGDEVIVPQSVCQMKLNGEMMESRRNKWIRTNSNKQVRRDQEGDAG